MENEIVAEMERVREYAQHNKVQLEKRADGGRLVVVVSNEAGQTRAELDLFDILTWLHAAGLAQLRLATAEEMQ